MSTDAIRRADDDAPTTELISGVVGDRCANCHAPLAPDQSYCVNCGERRGRARFSYDTAAAQPVPAPVAESTVPPRRFSSATTLIAGVATLLVAMGVGVLIGHDSNTSAPARALPPITINGGGGTASGNAGTSTGSTASTTGAKSKGGKTKITHITVTAKSAKAATAAAAKVLGSSKNLSNNVQQQLGGKCSGGAGCQNGTFTGNYFSGS